MSNSRLRLKPQPLIGGFLAVLGEAEPVSLKGSKDF